MMYFFAFLIMIAAILSLVAHGLNISPLGYVLDIVFFFTGIAMIIRIETKRRSREKESLRRRVQHLETQIAELEKVKKMKKKR